MEFATGALRTLLSKLSQLLQDKYNLHKGAQKNIKFLTEEPQSIQAALHSVGEVPLEQLSEPVKIWANQARELSYDMEDIVDTFLVRIQGGPDPPEKRSYNEFFRTMRDIVAKAKIRHEIDQDIKDIKERVKEVAERRQRYKFDNITPAKTSGLDPRIASLYTKVADLVGMDESREELISRLTKGDDMAAQQRIVSVVGFGGLGKTTLAKAVYEELQGRFDCTAFVPVGRNPDMKKVFKDILIDLDRNRYIHFNFSLRDERQLIDEFRFFFKNKRYFIVIDDIWDTQSWDLIKLALVDNNSGSRVLITTRTHEVAIKAGGLYKLQQLSHDNSRKLFFARICGGKNKSSDHQPDEPDDISDEILRKCEGVPLAIVTMASLLEGKHREEWSEVYRFIGCFDNKESQQVENTMKILSLSYYDLPPHLRTCLLYLSVFPEDHLIEKNPLIWMWIAEDFVPKEQGRSLFEIGEGYFNQLVDRSLIQLVEQWDEQNRKLVHGCHIHDMVLDLIRSISYGQNFVTILDKNEGSTSSQDRSVRRLALHNNRTAEAHMEGMKQVRSFISCGCDIDKGVALSSFQLIRVLAIDANFRSTNKGRFHLKHLRNLLHLRYLRLSHCGSNFKIVEEIGTLKFLQTLDVEGYDICNKIVRSLEHLTQLLCLRLRHSVTASIKILADGIMKLTSLEELLIVFDDYGVGRVEEGWSRIGVDDNRGRISEEEVALRGFMKALGSLRELRVLHVVSRLLPFSTEVQKDVVESLHKLQKMEHLSLQVFSAEDSFLRLVMKPNDSDPVVSWDTSVWEAAGFLLSPCLRLLFLGCKSFTRFPSSCISQCGHLSHLSLSLDAIDEQELTMLGLLPELHFLDLTLKSTTEMLMAVRLLLSKDDDVSYGMRSVHAPVLLGSEWQGVCSAGGLVPAVMARVQKQALFSSKTREFSRDGFFNDANHHDGGGLCLLDLASLQNIRVDINCAGAVAAEVEEVQEVLRDAAEVHPNRPKLDMSNSCTDWMMLGSTQFPEQEEPGTRESARRKRKARAWS